MQAAKEKISNMMSSAKDHLKIQKVKAEEKRRKLLRRKARKMAHQRKEAKVAEAKMHLPEAKLQHKAETERAKHEATAGVHGIHEQTAAYAPSACIYGTAQAPAAGYGTTQAPVGSYTQAATGTGLTGTEIAALKYPDWSGAFCQAV